MIQLAIVNGANLNLTGTREPKVYGTQTFEQLLMQLMERFGEVEINYYQSNIEGEIVNYLHSCMGKTYGIILNPGAYSHTSIAIADAVAAIGIPVIEVHISNIQAREDYRKISLTASKCVGSISGLGVEGYALAIQYFIDKLNENKFY